MSDVVVVLLGNPWRADDGAGPAVAERLRQLGAAPAAVVEAEGDPFGLLDAWDGARLAVVVDAVRTGGTPPGAIHRRAYDLQRDEPAPLPTGSPGTHGVSLDGAVALGRALGLLPPRLLVYGIEGGSFGLGQGISGPVAEAVETVAQELLDVLAAAPPAR